MADETEEKVYEIPLADLLEQAAEDEEVLARLYTSTGHDSAVAATKIERAKKFREQAQNIRERVAEYTTTEDEPGILDVIEALTGVVL